MTNPDLTLLGVLVDRSGSMRQCQSDMEGGLNTFIESQAKLPGKADITLAQFDDEYEIVYKPKPITEAGKYSLIPRGMTALLDAVGKFITQVGESLDRKSEDEKPGKVIICIVTDGYENASQEYKREDVKKLVEQQRNDYQWEFVFLGANMDAVAEGGSFGIPAASSMSFSTGAAGQTYAAMGSYVASSRAGNAASFSEQDRKAAMTPEK
jgi:hypothetical protein